MRGRFELLSALSCLQIPWHVDDVDTPIPSQEQHCVQHLAALIVQGSPEIESQGRRDYSVKKARTARELETEAAAARPPRPQGSTPALRGSDGHAGSPGLTSEQVAIRFAVLEESRRGDSRMLSELLGHYAFRLFLRGAIQKGRRICAGGNDEIPEAALSRGSMRSQWSNLVSLNRTLGKAATDCSGSAKSFGGTLEWYVARELGRRFGFDVAAGVRFHATRCRGRPRCSRCRRRQA